MSKSGLTGWSGSKSEEVIALLWLIAGLQIWSLGVQWLAFLFFVKAAIDIGCSIGLAILEIGKKPEIK